MAKRAPPRHVIRDEIIDLAVAEGHDADIPSNLGVLPPASPQDSGAPSIFGNDKLAVPTVLDKDIEKGGSRESISTTHDLEDEKAPADPNIVDFNGPNDPENPLNWKTSKKWGMVTLIAALTFLTPLASSMFAPGIPDIMREFHSTNNKLEDFMLSIYVLGFAFGPLVIAPLSEMYGRLPLYHSCNFFFIILTIGAALATDMTMFIVFRFFMGCFGGAPFVLGGGDNCRFDGSRTPRYCYGLSG